MAIRGGKANMVKFLIEKEADINFSDEYGRSPLGKLMHQYFMCVCGGGAYVCLFCF